MGCALVAEMPRDFQDRWIRHCIDRQTFEGMKKHLEKWGSDLASEYAAITKELKEQESLPNIRHEPRPTE